MKYFLVFSILLFIVFTLFVLFKNRKYSKTNNKNVAAGEVSLMSNIVNLSNRHKRI